MTYQSVRYHRRVGVTHTVVLPEPPYVGPGDVVSSATRWWGLRAYTLASVGANAVRLRRDSDNAEQDFATIAGGGLDTSAISSFKGAANLFIVKLYDQSGNGVDFIQTTAASQLSFALSVLSAKPVGRKDVDNTNLVTASAFGTLAQPFTFSYVTRRTSNILFRAVLADSVDGSPQMGWADVSDTMRFYAGASNQDVSGVTDNMWHAVQAVFNGSSSDLNINGTVNTKNPGTDGFASSGLMIDHIGNLRAEFVEFGLWASAFTSIQSANMSANQHAYWGF